MTSVTFTPDVGGDNITIDDSDSATTGLGNGGHRTRFMIALAQFMKIVLWVKTTAALVLGYRDAAATSASQALTYASAAQAAAGAPALAGNANKILGVNAAANGVAWVQSLPALTVDSFTGKTVTLSHTQPLMRYVESDQAGAAGVFQTQVEGGTFALLRNTAAARDFSTYVAEHQVTSAGRHLFGGAVDNGTDAYQYTGNMLVTGTVKATVNFTIPSDRRLKDNIRDIEDAAGKIERSRGVTFTRRDLDGSRVFLGVIAQELREEIPEAVMEDADGMLAVDYDAIAPVLIEAYKALSRRVRELERGQA